jgi:hypothetical protein
LPSHGYVISFYFCCQQDVLFSKIFPVNSVSNAGVAGHHPPRQGWERQGWERQALDCQLIGLLVVRFDQPRFEADWLRHDLSTAAANLYRDLLRRILDPDLAGLATEN